MCVCVSISTHVTASQGDRGGVHVCECEYVCDRESGYQGGVGYMDTLKTSFSEPFGRMKTWSETEV